MEISRFINDNNGTASQQPNQQDDTSFSPQNLTTWQALWTFIEAMLKAYLTKLKQPGFWVKKVLVVMPIIVACGLYNYSVPALLPMLQAASLPKFIAFWLFSKRISKMLSNGNN